MALLSDIWNRDNRKNSTPCECLCIYIIIIIIILKEEKPTAVQCKHASGI